MNRRALVFGALATVVILLVWFFLLWSPRQGQIAEARQQTEAAQAQAAALEAEIQRLQAAQRDEPLKQARRAELQAAVPDDPALGQFILDVNAAANASGIEFMTISPSPPIVPDGGGLSVINLTFSISGGYFQVLDFMNRLTDLPRVVVIDSVNVAPEGTGSGTLAVSLGGRMFTNAIPGAPAPTPTTSPAPPTAETTTTAVPQ